MSTITSASTSSTPLCIFCFQNDTRSDGENEDEEDALGNQNYNLQQKFFNMLQRHFSRKSGSMGGRQTCRFIHVVPKLKVGSCSGCSKIITAFCDAYYKMKCLELELDWRLDQLKNVMKCADGRPGPFRDWCLLERLNMDEWMEFRRQFQKQCDMSRLTDFPKVLLRRAKEKGAAEEEDLMDGTSFQDPPGSDLTIVSTVSLSMPVPEASTNAPAEDNQPRQIDLRNLKASPISPLPGNLSSPVEPPPEPSVPDTPTTRLTEPPIKRLKFSSSQLPSSSNRDEDEPLIIKESPGKRVDNSSCDSTPVKRKVREIFTCGVCKATFSSPTRLEDHVSNSHAGEVEVCVTEVDEENLSNEREIQEEHDDGDAGDDDWVADGENISDDNDDNFGANGDGEHAAPEEETRETNTKQKRTDSPRVKKPIPSKMRGAIPKKAAKPKETFKCRKCTKPRPIFASVSRLHAHQKYLHTNGSSTLCSAVTSRLLHLKEYNLTLKGIETNVMHHCSKDFPDCSKKFMLKEELERHQKYHMEVSHMEVSSEADDISETNAVDLVRQEIKALKEKCQSVVGRPIDCGKCSYSSVFDGELVSHYLVVHMNKPPLQATCPICYEIFEHWEKVPVVHYANYHDLTRLEDPSSGGIPCVQSGCSAYFLTEDQLLQHWRSIHNNESDSMVRVKKNIVPTKKVHRAVDNEPSNITCEYCPKKFKTDRQAKQHLWHCHADEKLGYPVGQLKITEDGLTIDDFVKETKNVCKKCKIVFGSKDELERHEKHHGQFSCNFCDVVKPMASELAAHEMIHKIGGNTDQHQPGYQSNTKTGLYKCPRCKFSSIKREDYINHHVETHLGVPLANKRCPVCRKHAPISDKVTPAVFMSEVRNWMVDHFMEHHDKTGMGPETMRKCGLCPGYFRTLFQLQIHLKEIHGTRGSLCECMDCGKSFKDPEKLKRHRVNVHKVIEANFQFVCSFPGCEYRFEREIELESHAGKAHIGREGSMLICTECGKKCCGKGQMAAHMKSHADKAGGEVKRSKNHVCDECGKAFDQLHRLKSHKKIVHPGPDGWDFMCSVCSKKCATSAKLNEHMRVHTKEKIFNCELCNASYAHAHNLRIHMKTKHLDTKVF